MKGLLPRAFKTRAIGRYANPPFGFNIISDNTQSDKQSSLGFYLLNVGRSSESKASKKIKLKTTVAAIEIILVVLSAAFKNLGSPKPNFLFTAPTRCAYKKL